jgi:hypothetical protein
MKKILVVLLILAVTTGVFAQGEWSVTASGSLEAKIDLNTVSDDDLAAVYNGPAGDIGWKALTERSDAGAGVHIGYDAGVFSGGIDFDIGGSVGVWANIYDETDSGNVYEFNVGGKLFDLLTGYDNTFWNTAGGMAAGDDAEANRVTDLWGYYEMLGQMLHLEAAWKGPGAQWWASDTTGGFGGSFIDWDNDDDPAEMYQLASDTTRYAAFRAFSLFGDGETFSGFDGHYLLANFTLSGLEFGVKFPWFNDFDDSGTGWFTPDSTMDPIPPYREDLLAQTILKRMVVGAKFDMFPFVAAAQLKVENYGVYLGFTGEFGQITAGLSFMGELQVPQDHLKKMKVGISGNYATDSFSVGLKGKMELASLYDGTDTFSATVIGVEPSFFINAIPAHLRFALDTGFYFVTGAYNTETPYPMEAAWAIQPALMWNFLGTGAGDTSTGFVIKYKIFSGLYTAENNVGSENNLTFGFNWSM